MFVCNYMSRQPMTTSKKMPVLEALNTMKKNRIRQLPVVLEGQLIGLVTERDLLTVSPSPASSLSVFELNYLLSKMTVGEVMVKNPLTVSPRTTIEEAALLLRENKIGSLPVLDKDELVGIITATDIFDALVNFFGYGIEGTRLVIETKDRVGLIADITQVIKEFGIDLKAIICVDKEDEITEVVLRIGTDDPGPLVTALGKSGFRVTYIN